MNRIDGETKVLGLIGKDTNYTLSPYIHNSSIKELGLNYVYLNFQLDEPDLKNFLNTFYAIGGVGLNVTKPYKVVIKDYCQASGLNSINTLSRGVDQGEWHAHSTDGEGFIRGLQRLETSLDQYENVFLIGAGGAALAIITSFLQTKNTIKRVFTMTRSKEKFEEFRSHFKNSKISFEHVDWNSQGFINALQKLNTSNTLMIQASSAPSKSDNLVEFVPGFSSFSGTFIDLIYKQPSQLYFEALNRGLKTQDGLPMLIEQARLSQEIWWGKSASYESIAKALKAHLT